MAENLNTNTPVNAVTKSAGKSTRKGAGKAAQKIESPSMVLQHIDDLDSLLSELGVAPEVVAGAAKLSQEIDEVVLEAAVEDVRALEISVSLATPEGVIDGAVPSLDSHVATDQDMDALRGAEGEGAEPAKKRASAPRKHYADKVERLVDRMGEKLGDYSVLTIEDAGSATDGAALKAVTERTLEIIRGMNSKEKNRATNFMEWLSGRRTSLNAVLYRTLQVLERDKFIQTGTGDEGNVIKDLLGAEYSVGSARAMAGNTIGMFADLKVIVPLEGFKGRFVANVDSLLLAAARAKIEAAPVGAPAKGEKAEPPAAPKEDKAPKAPKVVKAKKTKVKAEGDALEAADTPASSEELIEEIGEAMV